MNIENTFKLSVQHRLENIKISKNINLIEAQRISSARHLFVTLFVFIVTLFVFCVCQKVIKSVIDWEHDM